MMHATDIGEERRRGFGFSRLAADLVAVAKEEAERKPEMVWPSPTWRERGPIRFAFEVLGVKKLSPDQKRMLEAVWKNKNVSIASGHKVGKSLALAIACLWFWCSYPQACVMLAAVTEKQIERILWKEIRILYRQAKKLGRPLGGVMQTSARFGLKAVDVDGTERALWGVVANSDEAAAGLSGPSIFLVFDEASGIKEGFFEALGTSLAGAGTEGVTVRKCYISNPTRTDGEFARSHLSSTSEFVTLTISSEDTPNAKGDLENSIPGLAGPDWIAERVKVWGRDSGQFKIRVLGQFVKGEDGKIIPESTISAMLERWRNPYEFEGGNAAMRDIGRLFFGVDPAGPGYGGDESGFAARRGNWALKVYARRGIETRDHLAEVRGLCKEFRGPDELPPVVILDRDGAIGSEVWGIMKAYAEEHPEEFVLYGFRGSEKAQRRPDLFDTCRDELYHNASTWAKTGAIPQDKQLREDLHFPEWGSDEQGRRMKATSKRVFRKELGRSPDRGDALLLSCWEPASLARAEERAGRPPVAPPVEHARPAISPYAPPPARAGRDGGNRMSPYASGRRR